MNKDMKQLVRKARRRDWRATSTRSHIKLMHENGGLVIASAKLGDPRTIRDVESDMRRAEKQNG